MTNPSKRPQRKALSQKSARLFGTLLYLFLISSPTGFLSAQESEPLLDDKDLVLPQWDRTEWERQVRATGHPLINELLPGVSSPAAPIPVPNEFQILTTEPGTRPEAAKPSLFTEESLNAMRDGLSLFLPEAVEELLVSPAPTPLITPAGEPTPPTAAMQIREPTPETLATIQQWPYQDPLIDPEHHLSETPAESLRRFLSYHAENAVVPITVLVLAKDEKWPASQPVSSIAGGSISAGRGALLIYPIGEPWRSRLFLPQQAQQAVSTEFLQRLSESCLKQALKATLDEDQLEEYLVELSIRLFWLEKHLPATAIQRQKSKQTPFPHTSPLTSPEPPGHGLAEVALSPELPGTMQPTTTQAPPTKRQLPKWIGYGSVILLLIAFLLNLLRSWKKIRLKRRHRKLHQQIWLLPEQETHPRLGGTFCGGAGAWGSWSPH